MKIKGYILKLCCLIWCGLLVCPAQAGNPDQSSEPTRTQPTVLSSPDRTSTGSTNSPDGPGTLEIESLERQLAAVRLERVKTENYIEDVKQKLSQMRRNLAQLEVIRNRLDTDVNLVLETLTDRVERGLPVDREKRLSALARAKAGLGDYDADLKDKLGGVMAVLLDSVRYAGAIKLSEQDLTLEGHLVRVRVLTLGDLFMLAMSPDGRRAWRWNPQTNTFVPVDQYASEIRLAMEMTVGGRVAGLVRLPVGRLDTLVGEAP